MTIAGWIIFGFVSVLGGVFIFTIVRSNTRKPSKIVGIIGITACIAAVFGVMWWYYHGTASGQRELVDQRSNLTGGLEREINVYTADGGLIASYKGKIDIQESEGGYIKFDFDGKRYIYYNCFVETIANAE